MALPNRGSSHFCTFRQIELKFDELDHSHAKLFIERAYDLRCRTSRGKKWAEKRRDINSAEKNRSNIVEHPK